MKIGEKTFVSLSYTLTVDGNIVENVAAETPLEFIYGAGFLLPQFESQLTGLKAGDKFEFTLGATEAYGEIIPEAVVELPKNVFMIDGNIEDGLLDVGNQLPMSDNQGNRMIGTVLAIDGDVVKMDFNHPMAGKTLNFSGKVEAVREATEADMMAGMAAGGGCDCGCGCEDEENCSSDGCGCGCEDEENCSSDGCGCGCN